MKHIIFVWLPIVIVAVFMAMPVFVDFPVPFDGAIFLLGASISGYTGIKAFGIYQNAKSLPSGEGVSQDTKDKMLHVLIALYVLIIESLVIQYFNPTMELPLNDLLTSAGIASGFILGGNQAIKAGEVLNGVG